MLTYLNRKLAKLEKLIEPIWKEEIELKANRTNELPEFYIKPQNKKKKTKNTTDLPEFYIRHRTKRFAQLFALANNIV